MFYWRREAKLSSINLIGDITTSIALGITLTCVEKASLILFLIIALVYILNDTRKNINSLMIARHHCKRLGRK